MRTRHHANLKKISKIKTASIRVRHTHLGAVRRRVLCLNIGGLPLWRCLCGNDACYLEEEVVVARDWCVWGRVGSETGTAGTSVVGSWQSSCVALRRVCGEDAGLVGRPRPVHPANTPPGLEPGHPRENGERLVRVESIHRLGCDDAGLVGRARQARLPGPSPPSRATGPDPSRSRGPQESSWGRTTSAPWRGPARPDDG